LAKGQHLALSFALGFLVGSSACCAVCKLSLIDRTGLPSGCDLRLELREICLRFLPVFASAASICCAVALSVSSLALASSSRRFFSAIAASAMRRSASRRSSRLLKKHFRGLPRATLIRQRPERRMIDSKIRALRIQNFPRGSTPATFSTAC
jgi:hypothetical protein